MYSERFSYTCVTGSVVITTGKTHFHSVTVNSMPTTSTFILYDSNTAATGSLIAGPITMATSIVPVTLLYDVFCQNGLSVRYIPPVAPTCNLTFAWKLI